jgi:hypothetical protein
MNKDNTDGMGYMLQTVDACGHIPIWSFPFIPFCLARVDPITGELLRDKNTGLAELANFIEPGEVLS